MIQGFYEDKDVKNKDTPLGTQVLNNYLTIHFIGPGKPFLL